MAPPAPTTTASPPAGKEIIPERSRASCRDRDASHRITTPRYRTGIAHSAELQHRQYHADQGEREAENTG